MARANGTVVAPPKLLCLLFLDVREHLVMFFPAFCFFPSKASKR